MLAGLACLALAIALIAVVALTPSSVRLADDQWLRWMLGVRVPPGVSTAKVLNVVAGGTVMWVIRGVIAAALAIWRRWRGLLVFALAELCAELCIGPVKALVDRPRPAGSLVAVTGQSMPSGHVLTAGVTAIALALILTRPGRSRLLAIVAVAAWSILVALSRTYLSAHWLTDVLASLLLGTGWAALWFGMLAPSQRTPYPRTTVAPAREPRHGRPPGGQPSPLRLSRRGPAIHKIRLAGDGPALAQPGEATVELHGNQGVEQPPRLAGGRVGSEGSAQRARSFQPETAARHSGDSHRRKAGPLTEKCRHISPRLAARWALPRSGAAGILISFTREQTSTTSFLEATPDPAGKQANQEMRRRGEEHAPSREVPSNPAT